MTQKLSDIISRINTVSTAGTTDRTITGITSDSRGDVKGKLFVAVRGVNVDGHRFISDATNAGAAAVVAEEMPTSPDPDVTYVIVGNSATALGEIASAWFGNPSSKLKQIGRASCRERV